MSEVTRKLASIQEVAEIRSIDGADAIEHVRINGWWVVDKKGLRQVGDKVCYVEIDAFVPTEHAAFLSKGKEPRVYQGISGERLRTVKLRGAISQGLLLSLDVIKDWSSISSDIDADLTAALGIVKWEPPAEFRSADAKGSFPDFIPRTDQERVQNLGSNFFRFLEKNPGVTWEVQEKCEGSSITMFVKNGEFGVCSRNLQLKDDLEGSAFVDNGLKYKEAILSLNRDIAIQGELIGPAIQKNIYNLRQFQIRVFDVFDITQQRYLSPMERAELVASIGAEVAPIIHAEFKFTDNDVRTYQQESLSMADGKTVIVPEMGDLKARHLREGLVFKANTTERMSFKAISNSYLVGEK